jgi:branched-chain amino acid transport system permease protein
MIYRECGVFKTSYAADMALYRAPLAKFAVAAVAVFCVVIVPLGSNDHLLSLANLVGIAVVGAIGLNILTGFTGQISIGHGAFMAVGGYTAAILSARYGMPFWVGLIAGGGMAAVVGTFFGIPSLRIKGLYLAIATLAAQFIIEWAINHITWISGGVQSTIYVPRPTLGRVLLNSELKKYYMILVVAALAYVFAMNLVRSRVGRAFMAIRDRDVAAEMIGVNIFAYKLLAFAISSFYAGVAGALFTYYLEIANYEQFTITVSVQYLAMIIIGGLGSILGSVFGAVFITLLPIVLRWIVEGVWGLFAPQTSAMLDVLANLRLIVFGGLVIFFLILEPDGLYRLWRHVKDYFRVWPFAY